MSDKYHKQQQKLTVQLLPEMKSKTPVVLIKHQNFRGQQHKTTLVHLEKCLAKYLRHVGQKLQRNYIALEDIQIHLRG